VKHVLALLLLYGVFAALAWHQVPDWPYLYDEADYMFASAEGWRANYTDSPTLPFGEFLRLGRRGKVIGTQQSLSSIVRTSDDIVFYRHWHGTLYFYWLLATEALHRNPGLMRGLQLVFPVVGGLLIYFGCLSLLPSGIALSAAVLSTAMYLWSETVLRSLEIAPHQLFAVCSLAALFLLSRMIATGERRYWYGAVVCTALAFCTLEIAFVLVFTLLVCGHLRRRELRATPRFALVSLGLFAGTILLLWPCGLFRLSAVKAYLFMAYLAAFRSNAWGNELTVGQAWLLRIERAPAAWLIVAAAAISFALLHKHIRAVLLPFLIFSVVMIAAVFRINADAARYSLTYMPALDVFAGMAAAALVGRAGRRVAPVIVAALCGGLLANTAWAMYSRPLEAPLEPGAVLELIERNGLADKHLLVPQGDVPTIHYFFPRTTLTGYRSPESFAAERAHGGYAAIIYPGDTPRLERLGQP
jgi:hypothetical protein